MSPQQQRFVKAYLGAAEGNGTKAAILAGYSEKTAAVQASQLLKKPEIMAAVSRKLQKANLTTEQALENVGAIASLEPAKVTAADVLRANELILKVNGALKDKHGDSRITVNIGFLTSNPSVVQAIADDSIDAEAVAVVMPQQAQLRESGD